MSGVSSMMFGTQVAACFVGFVWCSFFEWFVHRHFMHTPRFPLKDAFRGHLEHHMIYRGGTYQNHAPGFHKNIPLRWYAFPGMLLGHVPFFLAIQWLIGVPILWGGLAACTLYFAGYEYSHYLMHAPAGHFVERFRWFRFIREHHRLHHDHMRRNYNVFVPLADACLGTLVTSKDADTRLPRGRRQGRRVGQPRRA
jgi:hypothetical protein